MCKVVAFGGTFDRLHKGHRYFISEAFRLGESVVIGLTSDKFAARKVKRLRHLGGVRPSLRGHDSPDGGGIIIKISNYQSRKRELENYLKREGLLRRAQIVKIKDVYGPAIKDTEIEALLVTDETWEGAVTVNKRRGELGLKPLKLLKLPMILAQDNKRIASTRIRIGEIDRWGRVFSKIFNFQFSIFKITDELRQELKRPIGKLIRGNPNELKLVAEKLKKTVGKTNSAIIITVGDEVTKLCNEVGIAINLAIVDFKVHRIEKYFNLSELGFKSGKAIKTPRRWQADPPAGGEAMTPPMVEESVIRRVSNPPGHITKELVSAVKNAYLGIIKDGKQRIIQVDGEEDLAGVPAVLLAPLGCLVLYGQPQEGVVLVEVTEEKKAELLSLITKFQ